MRRLCFVGPHLGRHSGWVISQGEILAELFRGEGWPVLETSGVRNPLLRFLDMARTLYFRRRRIDLVILSSFSGQAFRFTEAVGALCRRLGLPLVIVLRGGALPELFEKEPARAKKALGRADILVAPSPYLADAAAGLGLAAEIVPNVLDLEAYRHLGKKELDPKKPRLLWMRTFHQVYHPELAIEVLAILKKRGIAARLTMAGQDKGLEKECRRRAAELGLQNQVDFPGFLDLPAKRKTFAENDFFLNTNRIDNTPVTVLEAASAGLPIVATAAGGVPRLLEHEVSALLTRIEDAEAMAAAVERLLADVELRRRLVEGGHRVAEQSSWPAVYARWNAILGALPSKTSARGEQHRHGDVDSQEGAG